MHEDNPNSHAAKAQQELRLSQLAIRIHAANVKVGWWDDSYVIDEASQPHLEIRVDDKYVVPTKLCLVHSEVSEAMEGFRKGLPDDHLPQYPMVLVEIADAIIRLLDLGAYLCVRFGYPGIGEVVSAKLDYNAARRDHKRDSRAQLGGKSF